MQKKFRFSSDEPIKSMSIVLSDFLKFFTLYTTIGIIQLGWEVAETCLTKIMCLRW